MNSSAIASLVPSPFASPVISLAGSICISLNTILNSPKSSSSIVRVKVFGELNAD